MTVRYMLKVLSQTGSRSRRGATSEQTILQIKMQTMMALATALTTIAYLSTAKSLRQIGDTP